MTVYAIYVPTARTPTSGLDMERFPSKEVAGHLLLDRCTLGAGATYWVGDPIYGRERVWPRPVRKWEDADETGYMRVFVRRAADPVPGLLDTPDEEWLVNPGGRRGVVVRIPWEASDAEAARLAGDGVRIYPSAVPPAPVPVCPARSRVVRTPSVPVLVSLPDVCGTCFQIRSATGVCGCPGSGRDVVVEIRRPSRVGWERCGGCGKAVSAYARCGCS